MKHGIYLYLPVFCYTKTIKLNAYLKNNTGKLNFKNQYCLIPLSMADIIQRTADKSCCSSFTIIYRMLHVNITK